MRFTIRMLIKELLYRYIELENDTTNLIQYFIYKPKCELSPFDNKSLNNRIGLQTKLNNNDAFIVLLLFKMLYTKDFDFFKNNIDIKYENINMWHQLLIKHFDDFKLYEKHLSIPISKYSQKFYTLSDIIIKFY